MRDTAQRFRKDGEGRTVIAEGIMNAKPGSSLMKAAMATDSLLNSEPRDSTPLSPEAYAKGQVLAGKYRVERIIGEGAMGVVLAATHLDLDETVAIKFIRPGMHKVPGILARFAREAKASAKIKSEHIANVLDVGVAAPIGPYIVMEYLEGKDLCDILGVYGKLSVRRAAEYVMQACEALAIAHANGIIHRDIKPENLFLTRRGELEVIKVLDFGISKAALTGSVFGGELAVNETACMMGTPLYMSPEQIRSTGNVDHRADIWSLGGVLYELLTGRTAFVSDSVAQLCAMVLETVPTPVRELVPEIPEAMAEVIDRCLQKNPDRRFQNVGELAIALSPFAPSRARLHAERSTSILRASGVALNVDLRPSSMPPARSDTAVSANLLSTGQIPISTAVLVKDVTPTPASNTAGDIAALRRRHRAVVPALVLALGGVAAVGFFTSRQNTASSAADSSLIATRAAEALRDAQSQAAAPLAAPQLPTATPGADAQAASLGEMDNKLGSLPRAKLAGRPAQVRTANQRLVTKASPGPTAVHSETVAAAPSTSTKTPAPKPRVRLVDDQTRARLLD
ncbi:MAG TPA: serine/threonine-protein kinase [Polyangiaceae bacterium]|nr:serine/threonine-protein kinase [Polyangiaceae bacterium]